MLLYTFDCDNNLFFLTFVLFLQRIKLYEKINSSYDFSIAKHCVNFFSGFKESLDLSNNLNEF